MIKNTLFTLLFIPFFTIANEPLEVSVMMDPDFSMSTGAENLLSGHRAVHYGLDKVITWDLLEEEGREGVLARAGKLILVDIPIAQLVYITQHEIFGHGARIRERSYTVVGYDIDAPFPYGLGGGATRYLLPASATPLERSTIDTGGIESNEVLAHHIARRAFLDETLDYRDAILYLLSSQDQTLYIWSMLDGTTTAGHDIDAYRRGLNTYYGRKVVGKTQMIGSAFVNLVDTMTVLSTINLVDYLHDANQMRALPFVKIGKMKFLPGLRLTLAPYGLEYGAYSWFKGSSNDSIAGFGYTRIGHNDRVTSVTIGGELPELLTMKRVTIGIKADGWHQPRLFRTTPSNNGRIGAHFGLTAKAQVHKRIHLLAQAGLKSEGFLRGESLDGGAYVRLGVQASLF